MQLFNDFNTLIQYFVTLEPFIYLGVFSVLTAIVCLILKLARGERN